MEKELHKSVINYLKLQYPKVLFRSDSGAGMKLTISQAKDQKAIQGLRGWPDLFIAERTQTYNGLFIELKREGTKLLNKQLQFCSDHIREQATCHRELRKRGFRAEFAIGFNEAKKIIDNYLSDLL